VRVLCRARLDGDLGLKEWIVSALEPVDRGVLTVGYHPRLMATRSTKAKQRPPAPPPGNDPRSTRSLIKSIHRRAERRHLAQFHPRQVPRACAIRLPRLGVPSQDAHARYHHGIAARRQDEHHDFATEAFKLQFQQ